MASIDFGTIYILTEVIKLNYINFEIQLCIMCFHKYLST